MRLLVSVLDKARGLLGADADAESVALLGCASIHTVGMRYPIDVAFVSKEGRVLRVVRGLAPGRLASCRGSCVVLERPASDRPWAREGDVLALFAGTARNEEERWVRI